MLKKHENEMNCPIRKLDKHNSLATRLILTAVLMATTSVSVAEESSLAYVDSVLKWGAWELDIEPAAGGLSPPTTRALNARNSKVVLRTNSIAALAPPDAPATPAIPSTPSTPVAPPVTPTPPAPVAPPLPAAPTDFAPPGATPPTTVPLP